MKKVDDYIFDFWGVINYDLTDNQGRILSRWDIKAMMERIQKEAWNESIILSASSAEVTYDSDMSGRHYRVNKQSILKNLIP